MAAVSEMNARWAAIAAAKAAKRAAKPVSLAKVAAAAKLAALRADDAAMRARNPVETPGYYDEGGGWDRNHPRGR